ncbi:CRISPR-associated protein Cas4 [Defluviitalea saccharophila]|uniref:CRISPR-associated exonuclease Cas4 n=1 Tax=Defluviitalea saccharophila TaxID=879970 RepID=A0ABZ2Y4H3_9FIRM|nr:CRISPR-associated protein Cas4 [Candidatus Epulonipiscium sp.]
MNSLDMIWGVSFLLGISLLFLVFKKPEIQIKRPKLGVFGADIIYTDQKEKYKAPDIEYGKILYSEKYDLQGKPDYIFQKRWSKNLIPVELKSGTINEDDIRPHEGDMMQLAAYFLIIEDVYNKRPKEGRLIYSNYMFIIRNTWKLRRKTKQILAEMRDMLKTGEQNVNPSFVKCRYCICRDTVCEHYNGED